MKVKGIVWLGTRTDRFEQMNDFCFLVGGGLIARGRGKYNFERMANATRSHAPLSLMDALRRQRATCNYRLSH